MAQGIVIGVFVTLFVVVVVGQWKRWDAESKELDKKHALFVADQEERERHEG
jgi:hypothetical protein